MDMVGVEIVFAFDSLIQNYPDHVDSAGLFSSFLISAFQIQSDNMDIPLKEMVTVFAERRPNIIGVMEKQNRNSLNQILQLKMNLEKAEITLRNILMDHNSVLS